MDWLWCLGSLAESAWWWKILLMLFLVEIDWLFTLIKIQQTVFIHENIILWYPSSTLMILHILILKRLRWLRHQIRHIRWLILKWKIWIILPLIQSCRHDLHHSLIMRFHLNHTLRLMPYHLWILSLWFILNLNIIPSWWVKFGWSDAL